MYIKNYNNMNEFVCNYRSEGGVKIVLLIWMHSNVWGF